MKFKVGDEVFDVTQKDYGDIGVISYIEENIYYILWETGKFKNQLIMYMPDIAHTCLKLSETYENKKLIKSLLGVANE